MFSVKMKSAVQSTLSLGVRNFSVKTCCVLFDSLIASTASYGSELFVPSQSIANRFDVLMRSYFKKALSCGISTHSALFYGELKQLSFTHRFSFRSLSYFWRLTHSADSDLVSLVFQLVSLYSR